LEAKDSRMTRRRQPAHSLRHFAAVLLLPIVLLRLALAAIDLVLRALVWMLTRICIALEWAIAHLRDERRVSMIQQPRRPNLRRAPVPPIVIPAAIHPADDVAKFMRVLGTRDRAFAEAMLARGQRVRLHEEN
jgi:hypothetical protein